MNPRGERLLPQLSQRQASAAVTAFRHLGNLGAHFSNRSSLRSPVLPMGLFAMEESIKYQAASIIPNKRNVF